MFLLRKSALTCIFHTSSALSLYSTFVYELHLEMSWNDCFKLSIGNSNGIAAIAPFSHRLSFNDLPTEIQHLRCKVNFKALAFVRDITKLGDTIVNRLRYSSNQKGMEGAENLLEDETRKLEGGKFVVLHLRFDKVCTFPGFC